MPVTSMVVRKEIDFKSITSSDAAYLMFKRIVSRYAGPSRYAGLCHCVVLRNSF